MKLLPVNCSLCSKYNDSGMCRQEIQPQYCHCLFMDCRGSPISYFINRVLKAFFFVSASTAWIDSSFSWCWILCILENINAWIILSYWIQGIYASGAVLNAALWGIGVWMVIQISWEAGRKCQVSFCPQMKLPGQKEMMHYPQMPRTSFLSFSAKILWKEWEQVRALCTGKHCPEAGGEAALPVMHTNSCWGMLI